MLEKWKIGENIQNIYKIQDIKKGGMGVVYLCHDTFRDSPIALKTFLFESAQEQKQILSSFVREAKTWISIGHERNVVEAYYIVNVEIEEGIIPFIAMELIQGHPLYGASLWGWIRNPALNIELILLFAIA
jgi:serine/threonine protein kinase